MTSQTSAPSSRSPEATTPIPSAINSAYFSYPVVATVSGILRRLSTEPAGSFGDRSSSPVPSHTPQKPSAMNTSLYTPPQRPLSPFQPPPLTALTLTGWKPSTSKAARLLTEALAEEIRLLVPPRNQLVDAWRLVYSLDQDGSSLSTLYKMADDFRGRRGGYVLVVRDGGGDVFGAYLSDVPHPAPHFYGNGECFLWRASVLPSMPTLASLPPLPSEDTTHAVRMTTLASLTWPTSKKGHPLLDQTPPGSGTTTPERIRFKAFPYSGENDYMIFCEQGYLSVGGGDGHYGLWLDDGLEKGISATCPTFGNEPLSDEGTKFEVLGVELWFIGS